jgi:Bacteriophage tail assembly protein
MLNQRAAEAMERIALHRAGDYRRGRAAFRGSLLTLIDNTLKFPRRLTGSEWAETYGRIPKGTGAEHGKVTLYGYQRGLLDAMCDPTIPLITVMKAARVGFTRCATLAIGYHLHQDPTLCAVAQPVLEDAEDFGGSEIAPMLRQTPVLASMIRPVRKGEKQDKATMYLLSNGASVRVVGAASDDAFRRYSARWLFADELDAEGWSPKAKTQGDKLKLFWTRGETFWNRKQTRGGTPLLEETSRTYKLWLQSDQRRYFVPCPQCREMQVLEWGGPDVPHGIKWSLDAAGNLDKVWYVGTCGCLIDEGRKAWMDAHGEWRPTAKPSQPGHVGFHLWTGMSLNPNAAWTVLVREWLEAQKDTATLVQPFVNLVLGRPYKATYGQELKVSAFAERMEPYPTEVPSGVRFLSLGADVQSGQGIDPRVEASVYGWGAGNECWLIGHWVFRGDPAQQEVWDQLDGLLLTTFLGPDGKRFAIQAGAIDSGGHHTAETYAFCATRAQRRVWAIKGRSEKNGARSKVWPRRPSKGQNGGIVYLIGGNAARDFVYRSLAVEKAGPRYVHFPAQVPAGAEPLTDAYFEQLTAEKLVARRGGYTEWDKPKGKPHEAGVCLVYAYAAKCGLETLHKGWVMATEAEKAPREKPAAMNEVSASADVSRNQPPPAEKPKPAPKKAPTRKIGRSSYLNRLGR